MRGEIQTCPNSLRRNMSLNTHTSAKYLKITILNPYNARCRGLQISSAGNDTTSISIPSDTLVRIIVAQKHHDPLGIQHSTTTLRNLCPVDCQTTS